MAENSSPKWHARIGRVLLAAMVFHLTILPTGFAPSVRARILFRDRGCPACVGSAAAMNQHTKPPAINRAPSKDYTLALIRVVSRRLKHIDEEVVSIGVALSSGLVTAAKARELVDDIAPGCIDAVALSILEGTVE